MVDDVTHTMTFVCTRVVNQILGFGNWEKKIKEEGGGGDDNCSGGAKGGTTIIDVYTNIFQILMQNWIFSYMNSYVLP